MRWMFLPLLMGCTAARGTIKLVEAEQDFALAQSAADRNRAFILQAVVEKPTSRRATVSIGHSQVQVWANLQNFGQRAVDGKCRCDSLGPGHAERT